MKLFKGLMRLLLLFYRHRWLMITCLLMGLLIKFWSPRFLHSYRHYYSIKEKNRQLTQTINHTRTDLKKKQHFVQKTLKNPDFREQVMRDQFGVVKEEDHIIHFYKTEAEDPNSKIQF